MDEYFLEVLKEEEKPEWPRPEEELLVGSQPLEGGFVQHWAYPKEGSREASDLPPAEVLAQENPAEKAAVLIDQIPTRDEESEAFLELILVRDGHAWGKTSSSLPNLEDNLASLVEVAKNKFNLEVEHFLTTGRVSEEVEKKLDELEKGGEKEPEEAEEPEESKEAAPVEKEPSPQGEPEESKKDELPEEERREIKEAGVFGSNQVPTSGIYLSKKPSFRSSSKIWLFLPLILLLAVFALVMISKNKPNFNLSSFNPFPTPTPTLTPSPTPTPTPSVDRSQFKVRVLNGTLTTGAAADLKSSLEEKGWQVLSLGNATSSATPQTYVRSKEDLLEVVKVLISDLASQYEATVSSSLKSGDQADLEVVIGKK